MRTVLITLIGPERTSDLVVDADTPVAELLPSLLAAGGVAAPPAGGESWTVALTGKQAVESDRTLEQSGVLDGAVLVLRREADAPAERLTAPMPGAEPSGSPLERTRSLLHSHLSAGSRRARFRPQLPEPGLVADGRAQALERAVSSPVLARCATIAVLSPKGGVGKTTISILLGELMNALRSDELIALDADSDYGSLGRVAPAQHAADASEDRDSGIFPALAEGAVTFAELDRTLWALPGGLRIVPSPRDPAAMARTDRSTYSRVIGTLQRLAGVLVVDCGTGLGQPGVQAAVLASDQLVLLTDATGATASLAVEASRLLERAGRPITIVCNRMRRGRQGSDDLLRLDALFPRASGLIGIPDEPEAERALRGELVLADTPRQLREAVLELAASLALAWPELGLTTGVGQSAPGPVPPAV
jgi:MinD-like ATPase involved in chromosome partitioning or flagellar assembly